MLENKGVESTKKCKVHKNKSRSKMLREKNLK